MRLTCPVCGARDRREFYYMGAALPRPEDEGAFTPEWDDYVHLRDNPAGRTRELWCHEAGCGAWLVVERDTVTHRVFSVALAQEEPA